MEFIRQYGLPAMCRALLNANEFLFLCSVRLPEAQRSQPFPGKTRPRGHALRKSDPKDALHLSDCGTKTIRRQLQLQWTALDGPHLLDRRAFLALGFGPERDRAGQYLGQPRTVCAEATDKTPIRPRSIRPSQRRPAAALCGSSQERAGDLLQRRLQPSGHLGLQAGIETPHGQPMPGGQVVTFQGEQGDLTKSPWEFRPRGESGKMISTLVDHLGELADEMCFVHSMTSKTNTHGPGENFMSTGYTLDGFPSMGAWVIYALGTENENLPAYRRDSGSAWKPQASVNNWGPGFLPAGLSGHRLQRRPADPQSLAAGATGCRHGRCDARLPATAEPTIISRRFPATPNWQRASPATNWPPGCS